MAEVKIRLGEASDAPTIVDFQLRLAQETEPFALDQATLERGVDRLFQPHPPGFYVIAEDPEGAPMGCLLVLSEWSDWRAGEVWWIHSVYVPPAHRRKGVYRAMATFVEAKGRAEGARGLRLYVERTNRRAQAVYRRLGMSDEHYTLFEKMFGEY